MTPASWQGRHCLKSQVTILAVTLLLPTARLHAETAKLSSSPRVHTAELSSSPRVPRVLHIPSIHVPRVPQVMSARQHPVGMKNPVITDSFPAQTTPGLASCLGQHSSPADFPAPILGTPALLTPAQPDCPGLLERLLLDPRRQRTPACHSIGSACDCSVRSAPRPAPVPGVGLSPTPSVAVPVQQQPCGWQQRRALY